MSDARKPRKFTLPYAELDFSFVRSSGPGGQNVNKVNSKAVLRWNVAGTWCFSPEDHHRVLAKLGARLTAEGDLLVTSDRFRDQKQNKDDCVEKLLAILDQALAVPKARRKTKPTRASKKRKLDSKRRDGETKKMRGKVRV
ncbi:MAG: aminoacyl-tRNA hydrolase [Bdellovibrionales bacterium]|nr:aminoacyl-tRNA hydrolase [Bdellovibrionales bacterium]